jgi:hypothetical protein
LLAALQVRIVRGRLIKGIGIFKHPRVLVWTIQWAYFIFPSLKQVALVWISPLRNVDKPVTVISPNKFAIGEHRFQLQKECSSSRVIQCDPGTSSSITLIILVRIANFHPPFPADTLNQKLW